MIGFGSTENEKTEGLDNLAIFLKTYKERLHGKTGIFGINAYTSVSAVF